MYDYAQNTVKKVVVTGKAPAETASPAPSATFMTPAAITLYLQQVARFATVEVAGQASVAGQDAYLLRMTPVAKDSALGYVQAAIDGKTMVPLQVEVFAKGGTAPVIRFGFDTVSYGSIDPATFAFAPPAGAKVTTKAIDANVMKAKMQQAQKAHAGKAAPTTAQKAQAMQQVQRALLTRGQVAKLVPYKLAWARGYTARPFQWGYAFGKGGPLTSSGTPLMKALGAATGMGLGMGQQPSLPSGSKTATMGPSSVLLYGQGFGTIAWPRRRPPPTSRSSSRRCRRPRRSSAQPRSAT